MLFYIISIFILILLSAFFSGSETAFTSSSKGKIHRLAIDGNKSAQKIEYLVKRKDMVIATILLGNNIVNILSSAIATSLFINYFGAPGVLYATITMTILLLIFSEITPKTYALKNPEKLSLFVVWPLLFFTKLFYPITKFINFFLSFANKSSVNVSKNLKISDFDEIRGTIALKHKEGAIFKYDKDMISGILDLVDISVSDVMIHRKNVESINMDLDIESIIAQSFKIGYSKIPLWKGNKDNIVSILNVRKIMKLLYKHNNDHSKIKLSAITLQPWFIPLTNNLRDQLSAFRKMGRKFAIVVDEYGVFVGIITIEDILEEIVGNISEKEIRRKSQITSLSDGSFNIPGEFSIRDINRSLNWDLPDDCDNFSTLAGFVVERLQRIPEQGEEFEIDNLLIKVTKKIRNKIILLQVKNSSV